MTVRKKFLLIIVATMSLTILVILLLALVLLHHNIYDRELLSAEDVIRSCRALLLGEVRHLAKSTRDYAWSDDTREYMITRDMGYINARFRKAAVLNLDFNLVLFVDRSGKLIYGRQFYDKSSRTYPSDPQLLNRDHPELARAIAPGSPLLAKTSRDCTTGSLRLDKAFLLVASHAIPDNNPQDPPRGTLIIGRRVSLAMLKSIQRIFDSPLMLRIYGLEPFPADFARATGVISGDDNAESMNLDFGNVAGYARIDNVFGEPAAILRVVRPKVFQYQFVVSTLYFLLAALALGVILCVVVLRLTGRLVLTRLERLDHFVKGIEARRDLSQRIEVAGKDEIASLSSAVNRMLGELERDAAEQRQAELALQDSERRLRQLIDAAPFGALVCEAREDGGLILLSANHSADRILGIDCRRLAGMALERAFPEFTVTRVIENLGEVARTGQPSSQEIDIDKGEIHEILELHALQVTECRVAVFFRDITEQRRLQEQLRQTQKLDAIGQLAGGIAHDFNNLLTPIIGYANLLRTESLEPESVRGAAASIEKAAERASELTGKLLGFARRGKFLSIPVNIHSIVDEIVDLLSRTIDKNIIIVQKLKAQQSSTLGDPGQLHQVLLNLALNARDAMPEGGKLTFATDLVFLDNESLQHFPGLASGRFVEITISDTGRGIPREIQHRIFEPFFTTKEPGKGTGMGLAMVYGIVKNHGGAITVHSEEDMGTAFKILLPAHETSSESPAREDVSEPINGQGCVMIVDDEEFILAAAGQILGKLGYRVETFNTPAAAIEWYRVHHAVVQLVIIDMVMPELDGGECYRRLKEINPGMRALLSSGYGCEGKAQQLIDAGMLGFLQKPYRAGQLARIVQESM